MRTELIQAWNDYSIFTLSLNGRLQEIEQYYDYEIIDIKYSTFYDSLNKQWNYSALIIFKESDKE